jgi:hypothetical protein
MVSYQIGITDKFKHNPVTHINDSKIELVLVSNVFSDSFLKHFYKFVIEHFVSGVNKLDNLSLCKFFIWVVVVKKLLWIRNMLNHAFTIFINHVIVEKKFSNDLTNVVLGYIILLEDIRFRNSVKRNFYRVILARCFKT